LYYLGCSHCKRKVTNESEHHCDNSSNNDKSHPLLIWYM
jgi:RNA polymerase subunit RPABC4/transcription elongation factor Spt4